MAHGWHRWRMNDIYEICAGDIGDTFATLMAYDMWHHVRLYIYLRVKSMHACVTIDARSHDNVISFSCEDEYDVDTECNEWEEQWIYASATAGAAAELAGERGSCCSSNRSRSSSSCCCCCYATPWQHCKQSTITGPAVCNPCNGYFFNFLWMANKDTTLWTEIDCRVYITFSSNLMRMTHLEILSQTKYEKYCIHREGPSTRFTSRLAPDTKLWDNFIVYRAFGVWYIAASPLSTRLHK